MESTGSVEPRGVRSYTEASESPPVRIHLTAFGDGKVENSTDSL